MYYVICYAGADRTNDSGLCGSISHFARAEDALRCRTYVEMIKCYVADTHDFLGYAYQRAN